MRLIFNWKEFKIDIVSFDEYLRKNYKSYIGNQAGKVLELYFSELTEKEESKIKKHWEKLSKTKEAKKLKLGSRKSFAEKQKALEKIKLKMIEKPKSKYSIIEKKIELGLNLTNEDWDKIL